MVCRFPLMLVEPIWFGICGVEWHSGGGQQRGAAVAALVSNGALRLPVAMRPPILHFLVLFLVLDVVCFASTLSFFEEQRDSDNHLEEAHHEMSPYHRRLLAMPVEPPQPPEKLTLAQQQALWPSWWNATLEKRLQEDILIGIVTTAAMHNRMAFQRASWWYDDRLKMAEVYTDIERDPTIENLVYTHCDSSYHYGLWCKNKHMLLMWQSPRYRKYKWFIRANDDSYYHLENIYDMVSKLDHTKPIVIGAKYCWHRPDFGYPGGGSGFIISRGFVDSMNWEVWENPMKTKLPLYLFFEDVLWGRYMKETNFTQFIYSYGVAQGGINLKAENLHLYLDYRNKPWPFPFRPMAYHLAGRWNTMVKLHKLFHSLNYYPQAKYTFDIPPCVCKPGYHSACVWDTERLKKPNPPCKWNAPLNQCLGPKNYTYNDYREFEKEMDLKVRNRVPLQLPGTKKGQTTIETATEVKELEKTKDDLETEKIGNDKAEGDGKEKETVTTTTETKQEKKTQSNKA